MVLYDEHGGFYDHVPPPSAVPPDGHVLPNFRFDRSASGCRPCSISPWVERTIIKTEFDHTSLLKYLTEKMEDLGPLTERVAMAYSFGSAIRTTGQPRTDTPESVPVPLPVRTAAEAMPADGPGEPLNGHQKALIAFSEYLEREIEEPVGKSARMAAMMAGPPSQVETAKSRVEVFLAQQKAKAAGG